MRELRSGRKAAEDLPRVGRLCLDDIDGAILQKFNKDPFTLDVSKQRTSALRLLPFGSI
jgi:hypothetical protein